MCKCILQCKCRSQRTVYMGPRASTQVILVASTSTVWTVLLAQLFWFLVFLFRFQLFQTSFLVYLPTLEINIKTEGWSFSFRVIHTTHIHTGASEHYTCVYNILAWVLLPGVGVRLDSPLLFQARISSVGMMMTLTSWPSCPYSKCWDYRCATTPAAFFFFFFLFSLK